MNEIDVKSHLIRGLVKNDNLWDKTESAANCGSLLKVNFFLFFLALGFYVSNTQLNLTIQSKKEITEKNGNCVSTVE